MAEGHSNRLKLCIRLAFVVRTFISPWMIADLSIKFKTSFSGQFEHFSCCIQKSRIHQVISPHPRRFKIPYDLLSNEFTRRLSAQGPALRFILNFEQYKCYGWLHMFLYYRSFQSLALSSNAWSCKSEYKICFVFTF